MIEARIQVANEALLTFAPEIKFYLSNHRRKELRVAWGKYDFPARLRSSGDWLRYGYNERPTGGTGMQAVAQLVRFIRDLPRFPLKTWEYWGSEKIKLCTADTVNLLAQGGYGDPSKTNCVLCGSETFQKGLDWWSLGTVTGPCCFGGLCVQSSSLYSPASL